MSGPFKRPPVPRQIPYEMLSNYRNEDGLWHETAEAIDAAVAEGRQKLVLLAWVRNVMVERLTEREQECVRLHYFEGLALREIGRRTGTNASSVHRALQRGIRRLREAAARDGIAMRDEVSP